MAAAPDGSVWAAWLSFSGERDDIAIRHYQQGKWGNLIWVPGTSGDSFRPQLGVDGVGRLWVVWSQQLNGNWDLFARRYDPARHEWSGLDRLTSDPLPDIHPFLASDGKGRFALAWQGFRGRNSNIFLRTFDGERWSGEVRITSRAANDWQPSAAIQSDGTVWVAYDSYRNGNYDVFLSRARDGQVQGPELAVASTPRFEARASVAAGTHGRIWVAWEEGRPNWGKDQGFAIRPTQPGTVMGGPRNIRIRCYESGRWLDPEAKLDAVFRGGPVHEPQLFAAANGVLWIAAKVRRTGDPGPGAPPRPSYGYWDYQVANLDGSRWVDAGVLPDSKGRSSTWLAAAATANGSLWLAWPTDNRLSYEREVYGNKSRYHRPLRSQVFSGRLDAPAPAASPTWRDTAEEKLDVKPGHANEPGDLRAVRDYGVNVNGRRVRILRGDFHRHTELSLDGDGASDGSLQDFYRYMLDVASMDFGASTDHQGGGGWLYAWWYTQKLTDMYHVPGAYTAIFGFERSLEYPNGHRNIFYARRADARVVPFFLRDGGWFGLPGGSIGEEPGIGARDVVANDTKLLYEDVRARNGLVIPHTSGTRMGTDWRDNDPVAEPLVEIYQGARTNYEAAGAPFALDTFPKSHPPLDNASQTMPEGMVSNAWSKGYKLGVSASSDHGSTHMSYAMVYTADASRQGILDAMRRRHAYGATDNIILDVRMGQHFMGDEFPLRAAQPIRVKVQGTAPVARVDIIKDNKVIYSTEPRHKTVAFEFNDKGSVDGRHFYYVRVRQEDQMLAWSSPMFVNYP